MIYINDDIGSLQLEAALAEISGQRREQALKFRHEQGRRLCVAAYLLLKEGLRQEYGIDENPLLDYDPQGKPFLADHRDVFFNLSHCRKAAVCAIGCKPVGIDIEYVREYRPSLAQYTMNAQEMERISRSRRPDVEFIRLWTMKESLLKLSGEGIRHSMKDVLDKAAESVAFNTVVNLQRQYVYTFVSELPNRTH